MPNTLTIRTVQACAGRSFKRNEMEEPTSASRNVWRRRFSMKTQLLNTWNQTPESERAFCLPFVFFWNLAASSRIRSLFSWELGQQWSRSSCRCCCRSSMQIQAMFCPPHRRGRRSPLTTSTEDTTKTCLRLFFYIPRGWGQRGDVLSPGLYASPRALIPIQTKASCLMT